MTEPRQTTKETLREPPDVSKTREETGGNQPAPLPPRVYPDPVDDALDDSFPASDPPQWWGGGGGRVSPASRRAS